MKNPITLPIVTGLILVLTATHTAAQSTYEPYTFTTLAGSADYGSADGTGSAARFYYPLGVAVDSGGNVYVADSNNSTIRKVTTAGVVTTLAGLAGNPGSTDGTGSAARFDHPHGVAVDSGGNVYVADTENNAIRKVTSTGVVTTLAGLAGNLGSEDGMRSALMFSFPYAVAVDSAGNLYAAESATIRKVTPAGVVTTLAGLAGSTGHTDGTGSAARFDAVTCNCCGCGIRGPFGVAVDSAGNVYVADSSNYTIRKVTPSGVVTTLAGIPPQYDDTGILVAGGPGSADGTGSDVRFGTFVNNAFDIRTGPAGVAVDSAGNVYVADAGNNTIRKGYSAPRILNSGPSFRFNGGQFGFNLTGPAGQSVVVDASTDLVSWRPLWTNTFTFPVTLNFADPKNTAYSHRFYRAHLP